MAVPMISTGFGDLVDRRITKIFYDEYDQLPDVVPILFGMDNSSDQYETVSAVGPCRTSPSSRDKSNTRTRTKATM